MGIIAWIILGLLAGMLARAIMPGNDDVGIFATLVIGVVGALVGGFIAELLGFEGPGALLLLAILHTVANSRGRHHNPLSH
jgi:uncharacterized membrane protein YeaQ/YmgE (transglycosylase-associated protein family)